MWIRVATVLGVAAAAYLAGATDELGVRWIALSLALAGIALIGLQSRRRINREARREELLQAILDSVPHTLFYKDVHSRYLGINHAFERNHRLRAEDVVGKTDAELFGQALHDRFVAQDRELLASGEARTFDEEIPVEGEIRFIESRKTPFYDAHGKAIGIVGVAMDVTERRQLIAQLEESHTRLNVALRASRLGTWAWDVDSDALELDDFERQLLNVGEEVRTAAQVFAHIHRDDVAPVRAAIERAQHLDTVVDYEFRVPDGTGGWRWIEAYAAPHRGPGRSSYVIGVNRDITERKRYELELTEAKQRAERTLAELEQSRTELELALRGGQLGVWRSEYRDPDEAMQVESPDLDDPIDWDTNVRRIFGRSPDERVSRRDFYEALHPDDRERVATNLARAAERGHYYTDHYRILRPDGEIRHVEVHATFVSQRAFGASDQRWITGIARDITDDENLKASLRRTAIEAQQATEAKARFLAMMSHEIRTPLNGVVGMIELLMDTPLSTEQQQMLKTCKDSAFVLLTIINDILDFSKIEAGKLELDYTPLSPRRLVEGVGEALGTHAAQRGIQLDVYVAPDIPRRLIGDRVRLRQVLTNLISNAIKFTEQGGVTVDVTLVSHDPPKDHVLVRFDVADTGIGMDAETVRNLFRPFQQADAATTRRFGGTGLGLSIVKRLTELMGGHVKCTSQPLLGSRFTVVIPFETAPASERDWGYTIEGCRILALVSRDARKRILSEYLRQFGAWAEYFDTADAIFMRSQQAVAAGEADAVLIDSDWSASECVGLHRRFAEIPELRAIPFVMVRSSEPGQAQLAPFATLVNGNPLTRPGLIHGIAVALGRISPLVPAIAGVGEPASPPVRDEEEAANRLILLAEDNSTNREVISRQLARLGYACDVAEDGEHAWKMLRSGNARYALLLTDCHMPRLDGYQLTQRIREFERDNATPGLPIIAITANALLGEGERCLTAGMNSYLSKPVQLQELKRSLGEWLPPAPHRSDPIEPSAPASSAASEFPALQDVIGPDETRLRQVLGTFERMTLKDCELLDAARAAGDRQRICELAHKLKSGCRQLGDETAALALEAVERAGPDESDPENFDRHVFSARDHLRQLLARVSAYLAADPG